jgi:GNAT superfamily N-acetyltransferase
MWDLRIVVEPHAPDQRKQVVQEGLALYNVAATGLAEYYPVSIFLRDANDEILGGVLGHIWGKGLHVTSLWLAEAVRHRGYGTKLLLAAEGYARDRRCRSSQLETFSFQARPFYEQLGYEVFAALDDFPPGHTKYFLRKRLGGEGQGAQGQSAP